MNGELEDFQNADGGWPYIARGPSWTEPTVYALLALIVHGEAISPSVESGLRWLQGMQMKDGGWCPEKSVKQSTWVSALVALLPEELLSEESRLSTTNWLLDQTGEESRLLYRLRLWMTGTGKLAEEGGSGWAWFPGAAAWVTPTALTIVALKRRKAFLKKQGAVNARVEKRIEEGQRYLARHACASGGWNHGGAKALGYAASPYPETTGVALLALRGTDTAERRSGIRVAESFLLASRSAESYAWLTLGLRAQGSGNRSLTSQTLRPRTVMDLSLLSLANRTGADSVFVSP